MKQYICMCEDSTGTPHNVPMTKQEEEQDGMCSVCAEQVWKEMNSITPYEWYHNEKTTQTNS